LPSLREAIAEKYAELHQVNLNPQSEIVVTASGVQALNVTIRCVIDPGDEAIVLTPNWPNATAIVSLCGGNPREIPLVWEGRQYGIDFNALEAALSAKTKLLVYAERIYYSGSVAPSILRLCTRDDAVIVVQSFSKSYCMTGWRLGWLTAREDLAKKATQLNEFIVSHAPSMVQRAGEAALKHGEDDIHSMVASLQKRKRFCFEALRSMPSVTVAEPEGAFYLFPRLKELADSYSFALSLLKEKKVSVAPGMAFGNGGEGAVRICYAADMSILEPAMERLRAFLESR
jgi:aspartate/methionine/tyrosine aminotransferase